MASGLRQNVVAITGVLPRYFLGYTYLGTLWRRMKRGCVPQIQVDAPAAVLGRGGGGGAQEPNGAALALRQLRQPTGRHL